MLLAANASLTAYVLEIFIFNLLPAEKAMIAKKNWNFVSLRWRHELEVNGLHEFEI